MFESVKTGDWVIVGGMGRNHDIYGSIHVHEVTDSYIQTSQGLQYDRQTGKILNAKYTQQSLYLVENTPEIQKKVKRQKLIERTCQLLDSLEHLVRENRYTNKYLNRLCVELHEVINDRDNKEKDNKENLCPTKN